MPRLRRQLLIAILAVAGGVSLHAGGQEISAPYGRRQAPVSDGGNLLVMAPSEWCTDDSHELRVRRYLPPGNRTQYAARGPAGPSNCEWQIDGVPEGLYDADIVRRTDDYIVAAAGRVAVVRGVTAVIRLQPASVEVEGRVTINGVPPQDARLRFQSGSSYRDWTTPLSSDGTYRLKLDRGELGQFCIFLERASTQTVGVTRVGCEYFDHGLRRYDADVKLLPGIIRVEVVPAQKGAKSDWTSLIVVVAAAGVEKASSSGFKVTGGYRGEYFGATYGQYEVSVQTVPAHRILVQSRVTLSADEPVASVRLAVPTESLTCQEGWWSVC